jgi:ribosomal protein S1
MNYSFEEETQEINWDQKSSFSPNRKIKNSGGMKVYCHEPYAQELLDAYNKYSSGLDWTNLTKDLEEGKVYPCRVISMNGEEAFAQTDSGQTICIDLKRERRDAEKLGITGIDFSVGSKIEAHVRKSNNGYIGSVVEYYIRSLRAELFDQIKKQTTAYKVKIESINKGGYIVDLCGIKCFMPGSLAAANKITDFESYLGKEIHVMMEGYVEAKDIFIVSYKKYLGKIIEQKIQELDLTMKYKGFVTGTSAFGVFVEWDEIYTGLIHKSEFEGDGRVANLSAGDEVEFYVKEIKENNKLTLTLDKPLEKNVIFYDLETKVEEGTIEPMTGVVKHRRKNGVLLDIKELGFLGFVNEEHLSKKDRNCKNGDEIQIIIWSVDPITGKIFAKSYDGE